MAGAPTILQQSNKKGLTRFFAKKAAQIDGEKRSAVGMVWTRQASGSRWRPHTEGDDRRGQP